MLLVVKVAITGRVTQAKHCAREPAGLCKPNTINSFFLMHPLFISVVFSGLSYVLSIGPPSSCLLSLIILFRCVLI